MDDSNINVEHTESYRYMCCIIPFIKSSKTCKTKYIVYRDTTYVIKFEIKTKLYYKIWSPWAERIGM